MSKMLSGATKGLPQTGMQAGAGVGVFYLHRMISSKVAFVQNNPLAAPIGFILLGHLLKKSPKLQSVSAALIGAGGYAGAQIFEVRKAMQTPPATGPVATGTAGFDDDDTGMLVNPHNIGALVQPGDIGDVDYAMDHSDAYSL